MRYSSVKLLLTLILILFLCHVKGQQAPYLRYLDHPWVDSVLATLSTEEKIAQSIWISTGSNEDISHYFKTDQFIRQYGIGGLIINQGNTAWQTELINFYQSSSRIPLAVAMDGEWAPYPNQLSMEAISDESMKYQAGRRMAQQLSRQGMQVILGPIRNAFISAGFQENNMLIAEKNNQGHEQTGIDSALILTPGFEGLITTDTAKTTGLSASFKLEDIDAGMAIEQIKSLVDNGIIR